MFLRNSPFGPDLFRSQRGWHYYTAADSHPSFSVKIAPPKGGQTLVLGVAVHSCLLADEQSGVKNDTEPWLMPPRHRVSHALFQKDTYMSLIRDPRISDTPFRTLFEDETFADIKFSVQSRTLRAHKMVLQSPLAGPYFSAMLSHPMKEKCTGEVEVVDIAFETFKEVLRYICTGSASVQRGSARNLFDFYRFVVARCWPSMSPSIITQIV